MNKNQVSIEAEKSLHEIQTLHDANQKIAFYAERGSDWNHYSKIINELINTYNTEVYYITSDHTDPILTNKHKNILPYYIGYDKVRTIFFQTLQFKVFVTTMPDLGKFSFTRSPYDVHYSYVFSSLISAHMGYMHDAFDNYDSILCLGAHQFNEIKTLERHYGLKQKVIIECGYGHLENILDAFEQESKNLKIKKEGMHVVIAPTYGQNSLLEIENGEFCLDLFDILTAVRSSDDESYKGNAEGTRKAARLLEKEWPTSQTFTHASIQNFMRKTKYFGKTSCWTVQELIAQDSIHSTRVEDELTACIHDRSRILEGDTQKLAFYRRKGYAKAFGFDTLPNCLCGIKVVRRIGKTPGRKSFQKPYYCCKNHKFLSGGRTSGCKFWRLAPPKS